MYEILVVTLGWLTRLLVGQSIGRLVGSLDGWFAAWSLGRLVVWLLGRCWVGWLFRCLVLIGRLLACLVAWFVGDMGNLHKISAHN